MDSGRRWSNKKQRLIISRRYACSNEGLVLPCKFARLLFARLWTHPLSTPIRATPHTKTSAAASYEYIFRRFWTTRRSPTMSAVTANGRSVHLATFPMSKLENGCHCFSMCHADEARLFLSRLPRAVDSTSSPWYEYLSTVYHGPVELPFDLSRLRVFYRDTENWRRRRSRPRVGLPFQRCIGRPRPREWGRSITDRTKFL